MRVLGHFLLSAMVLTVLGAIWIPDHRWQLAATAVVLLVLGAVALGEKKPTITTRKDH